MIFFIEPEAINNQKGSQFGSPFGLHKARDTIIRSGITKAFASMPYFPPWPYTGRPVLRTPV